MPCHEYNINTKGSNNFPNIVPSAFSFHIKAALPSKCSIFLIYLVQRPPTLLSLPLYYKRIIIIRDTFPRLIKKVHRAKKPIPSWKLKETNAREEGWSGFLTSRKGKKKEIAIFDIRSARTGKTLCGPHSIIKGVHFRVEAIITRNKSKRSYFPQCFRLIRFVRDDFPFESAPRFPPLTLCSSVYWLRF